MSTLDRANCIFLLCIATLTLMAMGFVTSPIRDHFSIAMSKSKGPIWEFDPARGYMVDTSGMPEKSKAGEAGKDPLPLPVDPIWEFDASCGHMVDVSGYSRPRAVESPVAPSTEAPETPQTKPAVSIPRKQRRHSREETHKGISPWVWWLAALLLIFILPSIWKDNRTSSTDALDVKPTGADALDVKIEGRRILTNQLHDPDSLSIIEERVVGEVYFVKFRAKNGFGATVIQEEIIYTGDQ